MIRRQFTLVEFYRQHGVPEPGQIEREPFHIAAPE